nr:hypothetical protein [Tanacetum cinerariifolium]
MYHGPFSLVTASSSSSSVFSSSLIFSSSSSSYNLVLQDSLCNYAIASVAEPLKSKKPKTKSDSAISSEETSSKKKASIKADRGKGLNVLSEVALSETAQLKEATKLSKKDFHISYASGSGDGGTGTKPGVPDVPKYDSESDKESCGDSGEEDDDEDDTKDDYDNDDNDANDDDNQEDGDKNDHEEETDSNRTKSNITKFPVLNQSNTKLYEEEEEKINDEEKTDEEEDDAITKELYKDVNVNLGNTDAEMINAETTTSFPALPDFASVFKFNERVTNLEKDLLEMKQVDQKEAQAEKRDYIKLVDASMRCILKEEDTQLPQILPQEVLDFATHVIEKNVTESLEATVLARSSSLPTSTYKTVASISKFELINILIDKMEKNKSYDKANYKRKLYDALLKSYQTDKDLFDTYGKVFTLKKSQDDKDKDQDPSAGSNRGTKRRKSYKEAESYRDSRSKEKKSSNTSKDASHYQHKPSVKSARVEEPSHTVDDSRVQQNQKFDTGNNDEQPADKEVSKADWFKKPERPLTLDIDWNKDNMLTFDLLRPGLVKLLMLKNLLLHLMGS